MLAIKKPKKSLIPQIPFDFIGFRFREAIPQILSIFRDRGNQMALINTGRLSLFPVPSTFAPANTHANVFFVFLPGGISKECRHIVSANCDFEGNYLADIV